MCYTMKSANVTCRKLLFLLSTLFFNYPILICIFCHNLPISKAFFVSHNGNEERTDTHIVGYLKVFLEHPSPTLGLEENQVLSKKKSLDFDNLCLASLKFRHSEFSLDSWNLHSCAANPGKVWNVNIMCCQHVKCFFYFSRDLLYHYGFEGNFVTLLLAFTWVEVFGRLKCVSI